MKKIISLLVFSFALFLSFSLSASASTDSQVVDENGDPIEIIVDEEFEEAIPDEGFIEVEEPIFDNGLNVMPSNGYSTDTIGRTMKWVAASKTKKPNSYGSWRVCVEDISRTGSVSCTMTKSISNTYSGTIKAPIKSIEATLGYSLTKSTSVALRKTYNATTGKRVKIMYRPVYTTYQVKQNRVVGSKVLETAYVTSRKYSHLQYDVIEY